MDIPQKLKKTMAREVALGYGCVDGLENGLLFRRGKGNGLKNGNRLKASSPNE